jgi:hypothetical protein
MRIARTDEQLQWYAIQIYVASLTNVALPPNLWARAGWGPRE